MRSWVDAATELKPFRQAVHTILRGISGATDLQDIMIMKGGILLALGYWSTRFTTDIDFSTETRLPDFDVEGFVARLDAELARAVDELDYGVDCRVQRWEQRPPDPDASFPTIRINVGYADRGDTRAHRRLSRKNAPHVVKVDFSLNEPRGEPEVFEIDDGRSIQVYSFHDLVAEKYRAVLQQVVRNRFRRQDVYDLHLLLRSREPGIDETTRSKMLHSLKEKSAARSLIVNRESMRDPEIVRRSREDYRLLQNEIEGELPDFDEAYDAVRRFYEDLPWR